MTRTSLTSLVTGGLFVAAVLASTTVSAREATVLLRSEALHDTNVFSEEDREDADTSFRVGTRLRVEEPQGDVQWLFEYTPTFEYYLEHHELRGTDHDVNGEVTWQLSPRTTLNLSNRFRRFGQEGRFNSTTDTALGDSPTLDVDNVRTRFMRNTAQALLTHQLGPRHQMTLSGSYLINERGRDTATDQENFGAGAGYLYNLTRATAIGADLNWTRQIQKPPVGEDTETDFINLSGRVVHTFDPTFSINFSAGPALVLSDELDLLTSAEGFRVPGAEGSMGLGSRVLDVRTCPTLSDGTPFFDSQEGCEALNLFENVSVSGVDPNGGTNNADALVGTSGGISELALFSVARSGLVNEAISDPPSTGGSELTFFADLSLTKAWENWVLRMGYRRRDDSSSSAFGVTSVSDSVYGRLSWRPTSRLFFNFGVTWTKRDQSQESVRIATRLSSGSLAIDSRSCLLNATTTTLGNCIANLETGRQLEFSNVALFDSFQFQLFDNDFESETTLVRFESRYRLRRRTTLFGILRWQREDITGSRVALDRQYDRILIRAGVEYEFDPFRF